MSFHSFRTIQEDVDKPYQYVRVIEEVPHEVLAEHAITNSFSSCANFKLKQDKNGTCFFFFPIFFLIRVLPLISPRSLLLATLLALPLARQHCRSCDSAK